MEQQIRHVRFFNGQFLQKEEFNEEQSYVNHMRRRQNYALFTDGVVQINSVDLTIVPEPPPGPGNKNIRVKKGMAIGSNPNLFESREIILRDDTPLIDLTAFGGATVWVTINYRQVDGVPVSLGATTENSRVDETGEVKVVTTDPSNTFTADGDAVIILGTVNCGTMNIQPTQRQTARLRSVLFAPAPGISIAETNVTAGGTVTLHVTSTGGFNLSTLVAGNVAFNPAANISAIAVSAVTATSATITFNLAPAAAAGLRIMTITIGAVSQSDDFNVVAFTPPPTVVTAGPGAFPGAVAVDTILTINGTNFIAPVKVTFTGGAENTTFSGLGESLSPTQIKVRVPVTGASSGAITIQALGGAISTPFINIV